MGDHEATTLRATEGGAVSRKKARALMLTILSSSDYVGPRGERLLQVMAKQALLAELVREHQQRWKRFEFWMGKFLMPKPKVKIAGMTPKELVELAGRSWCEKVVKELKKA